MEEYSFQVCLKKETQAYEALLDSIISQLEGVVLGLEGDICFTSNMHEIAKVISKGMVPESWFRHSNISLAKWVCSLKQKICAIGNYRHYKVNAPLTIDIGAFLNKNSLFHALMSDWSRITGILLHKMEITSEVCVISPFKTPSFHTIKQHLKNVEIGPSVCCRRCARRKMCILLAARKITVCFKKKVCLIENLSIIIRCIAYCSTSLYLP